MTKKKTAPVTPKEEPEAKKVTTKRASTRKATTKRASEGPVAKKEEGAAIATPNTATLDEAIAQVLAGVKNPALPSYSEVSDAYRELAREAKLDKREQVRLDALNYLRKLYD
jgi:hypothetical protein